MSIWRALSVFLRRSGVRPGPTWRTIAQARERRYACSALVNCVDALLDEGKTVEAGAVLGQVDEMLEELDPPPEWLLRQVEEQAARLAALSQQEAD